MTIFAEKKTYMRTSILSDNQYITSEGISNILKLNELDIIVRATNVQELQKRLKESSDAVVVLDYTLFDFASLEQMQNLKQAFPKSSWALFSNELSDYFLRCATVADPTLTVIMKSDSREEIMVAVRNLRYDIPYISEAVEQMLKNKQPAKTDEGPVKLTASEKIILHDIAKGKTTKEIAIERFLSFHTVNSHRKNIFRKLEVNSVHEAIRYAVKAGIFDVAEYYI
jgi:DNA-binding NarL/FixJ family response regulator